MAARRMARRRSPRGGRAPNGASAQPVAVELGRPSRPLLLAVCCVNSTVFSCSSAPPRGARALVRECSGFTRVENPRSYSGVAPRILSSTRSCEYLRLAHVERGRIKGSGAATFQRAPADDGGSAPRVVQRGRRVRGLYGFCISEMSSECVFVTSRCARAPGARHESGGLGLHGGVHPPGDVPVGVRGVRVGGFLNRRMKEYQRRRTSARNAAARVSARGGLGRSTRVVDIYVQYVRVSSLLRKSCAPRLRSLPSLSLSLPPVGG